MNEFKIRQGDDGSFQILRSAVDEWGTPNGSRFVWDIARTREEANRKVRDEMLRIALRNA